MNDPQPEGHMTSYIGRRRFLASLGGAAAAWPLAAGAQQSALPVVGFVRDGTANASAHYVAAFRKGLSEIGWGRRVFCIGLTSKGHHTKSISMRL
jgi:putative ABC transport system substrate-binding protein